VNLFDKNNHCALWSWWQFAIVLTKNVIPPRYLLVEAVMKRSTANAEVYLQSDSRICSRKNGGAERAEHSLITLSRQESIQ
jgi:hypothetical protein